LIHLSTPLHQEFHFFFFLKKRIPFLPWDFRDFFLARFLVGAGLRGGDTVVWVL